MKLTYKKQVRIVKRRQLGLSSRLIAKQLGLSQRRVEQVWAHYCKTATYLTLQKQGRKPYRNYSPSLNKKILDLHQKYRFGATYIAKYLRDKENIKIGHDYIHNMLLNNNLAVPNKKKQKRRKPWIRYERAHSLTAVHMDWHFNSKTQKWVCGVLDDASRKMLIAKEFDNSFGSYTIDLLKQAYEDNLKWAPIQQVITDHGAQFYANKKDSDGKGEAEFQKFCKEMGIKHLLCKIKHPQTNGKIEKWNHTYELHRHIFKTMEEFVDWYNNRPHGSLDMKTPNQAFWDKMPTWFFAKFFKRMEELETCEIITG